MYGANCEMLFGASQFKERTSTMESNIGMVDGSIVSREDQTKAVSSRRFDWIMVIVSVWWLGGLFIDGWAHSNIPQLETFFTPWHAVLYSGYLAVAITLSIKIIQNLRRMAIGNDTSSQAPSLGTLIATSWSEKRWMRAIPVGYELSLLGIGIFAISGVGDMTWHLVFGIERGTEALLSPTHLGLALGIGLALSGPLRAAWQRSGSVSSWQQLGPAIVSLTFTFSLLTFFTEYAHPLVNPWPIIGSSPGSATNGITDILLETGLTMSFVFLALRRWRLPIGTFTFFLTLNSALMTVFLPSVAVLLLPTPLLAGLVTDLLYRWLQPSEEEPLSIRLFAFVVPGFFYLFYFINLQIAGPFMSNHYFPGSHIIWSIPFWTGAPVIAGITGFLLSYVMLPPAKPTRMNAE